MDENKSLLNRFFTGGYQPYFWLTIAGFLLYLPSLFFGFTYLDDNILILNNQPFLTNPSNLLRAFQFDVFHVLHSSAAYYRPILTISFMIDSWISGALPFTYHLSNILIHLLAVNLLFVFLTKLDIKRELAFFAALIFAVHPVLTQVVSFIPGRNDSLLLVFVLLSFIAIINYIKKQALLPLFSHFFFFFLALFTKESGLVLVPAVIFYLWLIADSKPSKSTLFKLSIGWLLIILSWAYLRHNALINPVPITFAGGLKAIIASWPAIFQFIGKIFFPINLSVLPIIQDTVLFYGIAASLIFSSVIGFSIWKQKGYWRVCLFGLFWFFGFLLPSFSFVNPNVLIGANFIEHRVYVPIVGLLIILFKNDFLLKLNLGKKITLGIFGAIILLLCVKNLAYQQNFKDRLSFWQNAVQNSPHSPLAHRNLGVMYYFDNRITEAMEQYQISLDLNPQEPMAHNNIGVILMNQGKLDNASDEFLKELEFNPNYDSAMFNLGLIYYRQNKKAEAVKLWEETLKINPSYLDAYKNLIVYYEEEKNTERTNYYLNIYKTMVQSSP